MTYGSGTLSRGLPPRGAGRACLVPSGAGRAGRGLVLFLGLTLGLALGLGAAPARAAGQDPRLARALKDLATHAEQERQAWQSPGLAVAVTKGEEIVYLHGFGQRSLGGPPVDGDTVFQIGSLSKAFTATLVARLVDEGRLKWTDRVIDRLPAFRMWDPWVTREFRITDLLAQRSGLPEHAGDNLSMLGYDRKELMHRMAFLEPATSFRLEYAYQNLPFLWAAALVEERTGISWENQLEKNLFPLLGMKHATTTLAGFRASPNVAQGYILDAKDGTRSTLPPDSPYQNWCYLLGPAGGINASARDMAHWAIVQANPGSRPADRILKKESLEFLQAPQTPIPGTKQGYRHSYALGWVRTEFSPYPLVWHTGGTLLFSTAVAVMPAEKLGIVILSNCAGSDLPLTLVFRFFTMWRDGRSPDFCSEALNAARRKREKAREKEAARPPGRINPPLSPAAYVGVYHNQGYGDFRVKSAPRSTLTYELGALPATGRLVPVDRDLFRLDLPDLGDFGEAAFELDAEGVAQAVRLSNCEDAGQGHFIRVK
ncbi:MAG: serine hydrolase [Deltaproteobacteria bacterium]|nr:serine hydrolase [Deltaproteobacteria bacterium]